MDLTVVVRRWFLPLAVVGVFLYSVLRLFPDEADCIASGRTVDPTKRHCEGPDGYVQLREHVLFHSREPLILVVIVVGTLLFVRHRRRQKKDMHEMIL